MQISTGKRQEFRSSKRYVMGVGASAGGLDAINELFANMPIHTGFSFVIVQHISPDHKSLMAELVSRHTSMEVREAEDKMPLLPNHIYVIPSGKFMTVKNRKLHLTEKVKSRLPNNAIDVFFESLAEDLKEQAIAVILSGTGSDGSKGIEEIKRNGGIVAVQDPATAAFDGMPNNAIQTGLANLIAPPELLAAEIADFLSESSELRSLRQSVESEEALLQELLQLIKRETGLDFSQYKRPTILRRLAKRMSELSIPGMSSYMRYVHSHISEVEIVSKEFLINVSKFFRDTEAFDFLKERILPELLKLNESDSVIRVWSIACSTGEEPYSLAILLSEFLDQQQRKDIPIKIFATDIDREALEAASLGMYRKSIKDAVPPHLLMKYFIFENNHYRIHPDIRKLVVFSYHDIMKDPPFSRMDMVSCRNMLIYINPPQQREVLRKIQFALNIGGFMFLGPGESLTAIQNSMEEVNRKWKFFKCISKMRLTNYDSVYIPLEQRLGYRTPSRKETGSLLPEVFLETLFATNKVAGLLINKDFEVKEAMGNYKHFLNFPEKGFHFNLLKMVHSELSIAISVALHRALNHQEEVVTNVAHIHAERKVRTINISVKPFAARKELEMPFLFVILEEVQETQRMETAAIAAAGSDAKWVEELQQELNDTRANMQNLLEAVETSNEELRSANEEMLSANEELQSTNEELQSLNEELHTVSAEHQSKIKELLELNDDLNNYFNNSEIGQLLVDRNLIIRKYSPAVKRIINIIDSDLNRSINDITTKIKSVNLAENIRYVIENETVVEKEVVLSSNAFYLMRIAPYVKADKSFDGVVVNFIDVTEIKNLHSVVQAVFNISHSGIDVKKPVVDESGAVTGFQYTACNHACEKQLALHSNDLLNKNLNQLPDLQQPFFKIFADVYQSGKAEEFSFFDEKNKRWYEVRVAKMLDGIVTTSTDVTDKKQTEDLLQVNFTELKSASEKLEATNLQLEQTNLDLMQFASIASHDLKEPLRKIEAFGNLLLERLKERFSKSELSYLEKIIKSANRMQRLIEDVLTFSKLSNSELPREEVDLNRVVYRIREDLEIAIFEKGVLFETDILPVIYAVKGQIQQLFQNLISNAIKFSGDRKLKIIIAKKMPEAAQIKALGIDPTRYIGISVRDNGIGFDDRFKDKIFGIFQRLQGNQYEGTGIGLAICRKIVENHHGFLLAESKLGEGSEFLILLPK
ncbi:MAG: chemotaxis protein CheB [Chitinophagales bacterium]